MAVSYAQRDISPSDIQSPLGMEKPYEGIFGCLKWEEVAAGIVFNSKASGDGKWVAVAIGEFGADSNVDGMVRAGYAGRENGEVTLTDRAIDMLVSKFPSESLEKARRIGVSMLVGVS